MTKMNDFEKAKSYVCDRNNRLADISKKSGIPVPTLNSYRANPEKLKTAAWERVYKLAIAYDAE